MKGTLHSLPKQTTMYDNSLISHMKSYTTERCFTVPHSLRSKTLGISYDLCKNDACPGIILTDFSAVYSNATKRLQLAAVHN